MVGSKGTSDLGHSLYIAAVAIVGVKNQETRSPTGVTLCWGAGGICLLIFTERNAGT